MLTMYTVVQYCKLQAKLINEVCGMRTVYIQYIQYIQSCSHIKLSCNLLKQGVVAWGSRPGFSNSLPSWVGSIYTFGK